MATPVREPRLAHRGAARIERPSRLGHRPVDRVLRFLRYSFMVRAIVVTTLGTLMSCSGCNTCLLAASWIGCNALSGNTSSGCGSCGSEEDEEEPPSRELLCDDGEDDDADGTVDCDDLDCRRAGACGEYYCYDGRDDDGDGLIDCDDEDCCDFEACRCLCQARCDADTTLCVSDEASCDYECCPAGRECVDGRCSDCGIDCGAGYVPCWTGESLCAHLCCSPGQECGDGACRCATECPPGTAVCVVDEWTCAHECCGMGDVCSGGGCTPLECAASVVVDGGTYEIEADWSELGDAIDLTGVEGCVESAGAELLVEVDVAPAEAVVVEALDGRFGAIHVLDRCPPTRCVFSSSGVHGSALLWINGSSEEERVVLLFEGDEREELSGLLRVSPATGETCEAAIVVAAADGATWTAHAGLFGERSEESLCGATADRRLWFEVELGASERLEVEAWTDEDEVAPSIAVVGGTCGDLQCLARGQAVVSVLNDLRGPRVLWVAIEWSAGYDGELTVDLLVR